MSALPVYEGRQIGSPDELTSPPRTQESLRSLGRLPNFAAQRQLHTYLFARVRAPQPPPEEGRRLQSAPLLGFRGLQAPSVQGRPRASVTPAPSAAAATAASIVSHIGLLSRSAPGPRLSARPASASMPSSCRCEPRLPAPASESSPPSDLRLFRAADGRCAAAPWEGETEPGPEKGPVEDDAPGLPRARVCV